MSTGGLRRKADEHRAEEFLRLLGRYERGLRAYTLSMVPHWDDAEEIIQEVRIRLWQQFDQYDSTKDFGAWARTIAYYQVLTFREKASRQRIIFSQETVESLASEEDTISEELALRQRLLRNCLKRLDDGRRRLLIGSYTGKETLRQISQRLGRSYDATRQEVLRTRHALAKCVEQILGKEEQ